MHVDANQDDPRIVGGAVPRVTLLPKPRLQSGS
jgi:hypothetical protein